MSETTMRITYELRQNLEQYKKERFGAFSTMPLYEVVSELIKENEKLKARISDLEEDRKREEERAVREDVYLGEDLKEKITEVQNELGINTRELIDFFLTLYQSQTSIPMRAFQHYVQVKNIDQLI